MNLAGNLGGQWEFGVNWDSGGGPESAFVANLGADGSLSVAGDKGSKGVWIQGTEDVAPFRVSLSIVWNDALWIFEGTTEKLTGSQSMSGASVGVLADGVYYRGAWIANRASPA